MSLAGIEEESTICTRKITSNVCASISEHVWVKWPYVNLQNTKMFFEPGGKPNKPKTLSTPPLWGAAAVT